MAANYKGQKCTFWHTDPFTGFVSGVSREVDRRNGAAGSASDCGSGGREIETHLRQIIFCIVQQS